jgi:hypothetical protein
VQLAEADRVGFERALMPATQCDQFIRLLDIELERVVEGRRLILVVGDLCLHFSLLVADGDKGAHVAEHVCATCQLRVDDGQFEHTFAQNE